jgi:hypothetical protein
VYNNRIYNLSSTTTSTGYVIGIEAFSGAAYNIFNNMISDIKAPSSLNTTGGVRGISGGNGGLIRLFYNTIYLNDIALVSGYTSAGLLVIGSSFDSRNNIIVNNSNVTNGTRAVAIWKTTNSDNIIDSSNNNIYYAGIPDSKHLVFYDGANLIQTIVGYNSMPLIYPAESHSHSENVLFQAITNGILRPNLTAANHVESGGLVIAGFNTDFENNSRGTYPLSGQAGGCGFYPDRGADEGDFLCTPCSGANGGTSTGGDSDLIICESDSTYLTNSGYSDNVNNLFEWESSPAGANAWTGTGISNPGFYHTGVLIQSTDYRLRVMCTTNNSTAYSNIVNLKFIPHQPVNILKSTGAICPAGSGTISLFATGTFASFSWSPAIGLSGTNTAMVTSNPTMSTDYTVIATDTNGCISSASSTAFVCPAESSKGTDFWLMFNSNYDASNVLTLFISSEFNTSGVVSGLHLHPFHFCYRRFNNTSHCAQFSFSASK